MSGIVVVGASARVAGYVLAGVTVITTDDVGIETAWSRVPPDTGLVLLTPEVADELRERLTARSPVLWAVMPA